MNEGRVEVASVLHSWRHLRGDACRRPLVDPCHLMVSVTRPESSSGWLTIDELVDVQRLGNISYELYDHSIA